MAVGSPARSTLTTSSESPSRRPSHSPPSPSLSEDEPRGGLRSAAEAKLEQLERRHNFRRSRSGGLTGDRQRLHRLLEERGGGSVLRGWRRELDPDGDLEVNFQEFCRAMAGLGVHIDALRLFGTDGTPHRCTLEDLAPVQAALVGRFREWVRATFGGPGGMFAAFDPEGLGQVSREAFMAGCKERRFKTTEYDLEELFSCLDFDDGGSVTQDEVMFLEIDPYTREREIFNLKMKSKNQRQRLLAYVYWDDGHRIASTKHRCAQRPWLAETFEKLPALVCEKRLDQQQDAYKKCILARITFLQHLRRTYSNEVRAWRRGLDPDCHFHVSRSSLRQYCRLHDLDLDFPALWRALDKDGDGRFALEEIGVGPALALANLRSWCHAQFGSCAAVWDLPDFAKVRTRPHMHGRWVSDKKMPLGALAQALKALGWVADAGEPLYQALDLYGCGFVSLPDFWWLDAWEPPEWLVEQPDPSMLVELQAVVQNVYPQPMIAWRALLDTDSDNQVSWTEFQAACRRVKFRGNVGAAWRCLDRDVSGTISVREWDPLGAELLGSFKRWADAQFGSIELTFKAFEKSGSGTLTLSELRRACRRLQWDGDVRQLFSCFGIATGKEGGKTKTLALADVAFIDSWIDEGLLRMATTLDAEDTGAKAAPPGSSPAPREGEGMQPSASALSLAGPRFPASAPVQLGSRGASSEAGGPDDGGRAAAHRPVSEHERLHRTYHCVAAARRRPLAAGARSRSLAWLDKVIRAE